MALFYQELLPCFGAIELRNENFEERWVVAIFHRRDANPRHRHAVGYDAQYLVGVGP